MKKLLMALMLMPLMALADTWTDPATGITWTYDEIDGRVWLGSSHQYSGQLAIPTSTKGAIIIPPRINEMPVRAIGYGAFCNCHLIDSVDIPEGVDLIYPHAFMGCRGLESVSIPASLTYIGQEAFLGCDEIKAINISDLAAWCKIDRRSDGSCLRGGALFLNGDKIENLVVPDGVDVIRDYAFESIVGLKTVIIPSSVTNVGYRAFMCTDLEFVCFEGNAPANAGLIYGEYNDDITITYVREGTTGWGAVSDKWCRCPIETWTNYPDVPWISIVTEVDGVKWQYYTHGGDAIVMSCLDAKGDLVIPESLEGHKVVSIADEAFSGCSLITSLKMPESLVRIGEKAFCNCVALTSVSIPTGVIWIRDETFSGCRGLESVQIAGSGVRVGDSAFYGCRGLKSLTLSGSVTSIGDYAFYDCRGLTSVVMSGITDIGESAFYCCYGLTSVTIPSSVTHIGKNAFANCSIENVYVDNLPAFARICFENECSNPMVHPTASLYADGKLVEETVKVSFVLEDDWFAGFYDESAEWGYSTEMTIEKGVGRPVYPPEVIVFDGRFEVRSWDADLLCVMNDTEAHPVYGGAEINDAVYSFRPYDTEELRREWMAAQCSFESFVYDAFTGCVRAEGTLDTQSSPLRDLDGTRQYGTIDERLYANLRIRLIGWDDQGNRICQGDAQRVTTWCGFDWSGVLQIDTNKVRQIDLALCSTWYRGEYLLRHFRMDEIEVYGREYAITYENVKGVKNSNPTTYTVTNEIVFAALPDTDEYWFKGWEPAKIEVGTTGDLVVTAKWDRIQSVAEAVDDQNRGWVSSGDADWFVTWNDEKGKYVVRSGEIGRDQISVLETVATNGGTISFDVKVSCEGMQRGQRTDGLSILVDGVEELWLDGAVDWTNVTIAVAGEGEHRIGWKYSKDVEGAAGDDCAYLANFKFYHQVVVSFDGGGATVGEVPQEIVSYNGGMITLPEVGTMKKINHSFVGWSDGVGVHDPGEMFVIGDVPPTFTAVWSRKELESPGIDIPARYETERTRVTISAVEGATIRYTIDGSDPLENGIVYRGPFEVAGSLTVRAVAVRDDWYDSAIVEASTVRAPWGYAECLNCEDAGFTSGGDSTWVRDLLVSHDGAASVRSGKIGNNETNWLEVTVIGAGTLSFWWKASAEMWRQQFVDCGTLWIDGVEQEGVKIGNHDDWRQELITIKGSTRHTIRWEYSKDVEDGVPFEWEDCIWLDEVKWFPVLPFVTDDTGATVTGDAETGFVVKPSEGKTAVEVRIPQGVDAAKVTVEVSPKIASVKPNGAKVKVVSGGADITEFLNVPAADGNGVVDLTKATVKEEIVTEVLDFEKGAKIELNAADPKLTTAPTRVGLFYQLREGRTIEGMSNGDSTIGDGNPWKPEVKVKGGNSAFYSIGVGKGE